MLVIATVVVLLFMVWRDTKPYNETEADAETCAYLRSIGWPENEIKELMVFLEGKYDRPKPERKIPTKVPLVQSDEQKRVRSMDYL